MHRLTRVPRTAEAMPSAASCGVPRWPTIAESDSRNSGSATRARNAGTASRRISRSCSRRTPPRATTTRVRLGATRTCVKPADPVGIGVPAGLCRQRNWGVPDDEHVNRNRPENFRPQPVRERNRRSAACSPENGLVVHSAPHRVPPGPAACSTRSTGLSTGACGRRAWTRSFPRLSVCRSGSPDRTTPGDPTTGSGVRTGCRWTALPCCSGRCCAGAGRGPGMSMTESGGGPAARVSARSREARSRWR